VNVAEAAGAKGHVPELGGLEQDLLEVQALHAVGGVGIAGARLQGQQRAPSLVRESEVCDADGIFSDDRVAQPELFECGQPCPVAQADRIALRPMSRGRITLVQCDLGVRI